MWKEEIKMKGRTEAMDYDVKKDSVNVTVEEAKKISPNTERIKEYAEKLGIKLQDEENE